MHHRSYWIGATLILMVVGTVFASCSKGSKAVPLTILNLPECPGVPDRHELYATPVVYRIEDGKDYLQAGILNGRNSINSAWEGWSGTLKIGTCVPSPAGHDCGQPVWISETRASLAKDPNGLTLVMPKLTLRCADGSHASN